MIQPDNKQAEDKNCKADNRIQNQVRQPILGKDIPASILDPEDII